MTIQRLERLLDGTPTLQWSSRAAELAKELSGDNWLPRPGEFEEWPYISVKH